MNGSVEFIWSNKKSMAKNRQAWWWVSVRRAISRYWHINQFSKRTLKSLQGRKKWISMCVYIVTLSNAKKSVQTCHMQGSASVVPSQLSQFFLSKLETFMGKITYRTLLLLSPSEPPATWSSSLTIEWVRDTLQTPPLRVVILEFLFSWCSKIIAVSSSLFLVRIEQSLNGLCFFPLSSPKKTTSEHHTVFWEQPLDSP